MAHYNRSIIGLCGPSGSGKGFIYKELKKAGYNIEKVVSYTSRIERPGDVRGEDYTFISEEKFRQLIEEGAFIEYEEYAGNLYGTPLNEIETIWNNGDIPLLDIDYKGMNSIRKKFKDICTILSFAIFPCPLNTSLDEMVNILQSRLVVRDTDTPQSIEKRLTRSREEVNILMKDDNFIKIENVFNSFSLNGLPSSVVAILENAPMLKLTLK